MAQFRLRDRRSLRGSICRINSHIERLESRVTLDSQAPYVVSMAPADSSTLVIRFNEAVTNFGLSDLKFAKDGEELNSAAFRLNTVTDSTFELAATNLDDGDYQIQLVAAASGIEDFSGHRMIQDANAQWLVENQLPSWKVDFTAKPVPVQPIRRLAALGDSMTLESGGSYVNYVRQSLSESNAKVDTYAGSGWKAEQIQSVWNTTVRPAEYDTIIVFAGLPNLTTSAGNADSIFATLRSIYEQAMDDGVQVVCISIGPWAQYKKWTAERQFETERLNSLIENYAASHPTFMRYVDGYSALGMSDEPKRLAPRFDNGDGAHIASTGEELLAGLVVEALDSWDAPGSVSQSAYLQFNEAVFGLRRQQVALAMGTERLDFQFTQINSSRYRIDFVLPESAITELNIGLELDQGAIVDRFGNRVRRQPTGEFVIDTQRPELELSIDQPSLSSHKVDKVRVAFNEPVTDVTLNNFVLLRERIAIDPTGQSINRIDDRTFELMLGASSITDGNYQLVFMPGTNVSDNSGNFSNRGEIARWVTLPEEPRRIGDTLYLPGTVGVDNLEVIVGWFNIEYVIRGMTIRYNRIGIERVVVTPGGGRDLVAMRVLHNASPVTLQATSSDAQDRAYLFDSALNDLFEATPASASIKNSRFQSTVTGFEQVTAVSRSGTDSAWFTDSSGSDQLDANGWITSMKGAGYFNTALSFATAIGISSRGGTDTANLFDTPGDDIVDATMSQTNMHVPGYTYSVRNFSRVNVRASQGTDQVQLFGSTSSERFSGQASSSVWSAGSLSQYYYGFDSVAVNGGGGNDQATFYDSPANELLTASTRSVRLTSNFYELITNDYARTNVYARSGTDTANFVGSGTTEAFIGQSTFSSLVAGAFSTYAYAFDSVTFSGNGGSDSVKLYDSASNDVFVANANTATLSGPGYQVRSTNNRSVTAYARTGFDSAFLTGTSNTETLTDRATASTMTGSNFSLVASGFDRVTADSGGGADVATLYDSTGDDQFEAGPLTSTLSSSSFQITAKNYARVNAYASTGNDRATLTGSVGNEIYTGRPEYSSLKGTLFLLFASGFDSVVASGGGGSDIASFYDSAGNDRAIVGYRSASLIGTNFNNAANEFYRVNVYASSGFDTATISDTLNSDTLHASGATANFQTTGFAAVLNTLDSIRLRDSTGGADRVVRTNFQYELLVGLGWT